MENGLVKSEQNEPNENWAIQLSESSLCPAHLKKKPKDILYTIQLGNELSIPTTVAINSIYVIGDKPTLGAHLYKSLALRGGVTWKILKNAEPVYRWSDSTGNSYLKEELDADDTFKTFPFSITKLPNGFTEKIAPQFADKILVFRSEKPIDYITQIEFKRKVQGEVMIHTQEYRLKDAITAGLAGEGGSNQNWQKRPKNMISARCFTEGIRNIAPDTVMGMYHKDEILDTLKKEYTAEDVSDIVTSEVVN